MDTNRDHANTDDELERAELRLMALVEGELLPLAGSDRTHEETRGKSSRSDVRVLPFRKRLRK